MSHHLQSATQSPSPEQELVIKDLKAPIGFRSKRLRMKCRIPFKNEDGSGQEITVDTVLAALRILFGHTTITFGKSEKKDFWFTGASFDLLREFALVMEQDDVQMIDSATGLLVEALGNETDGLSGGVVASGATKTITVEVSIPFVYTRSKTDPFEWCPGTSQLKQMEITAKRGSGFEASSKLDGKWSQNGEMSVVVLGDLVPGDDEWHELPRLYRLPSTKELTSFGQGGRLLCIYERTEASADSTLDLMELYGDLDDGTKHVLHDQVTAQDIYRDKDREMEEGDADLGDLATVLYRPPLGTKGDEIPAARRWAVRQITQSPVELDLVFVVAPVQGAPFVDLVAKNLVHEKGGNESTVKLSSAVLVRDPTALAQRAATAGVRISRPGGTDFASQPGQVISRFGAGDFNKEIDIPALVRAQVQSVTSTGSVDERKALAAKVVARIGATVPGDTAISRSTTQQVQKSPTASAVALKLGGGIASLIR